MVVKIKYLQKNVPVPEYATQGSAGMDLAAALSGPVTVPAGGRALIPTGIAIQIPEGYGGFIFPRSGLAFKKGISMCNSVGVIDSDYTGEIKVAVHNISEESYTINPGDRIAQLVFLPVARAQWEETDELDQTERGAGGFGSTGR
ncbi:dUTP diphosphatase [Ructibacterium gallinarum]|uniref:Deoxyuridine 5'-triphosphate nucleotidohydrolase n=1 Tax=Ructibacterium gallinarum TaxID=2779355 RepID=A0A9D5M096_9FIRM|nr:dUTP diphosphatase [Ructibacterium gallinarum]MBE5039771.1 dUTP diphosphatase [Ructibacterium gallinarum]